MNRHERRSELKLAKNGLTSALRAYQWRQAGTADVRRAASRMQAAEDAAHPKAPREQPIVLGWTAPGYPARYLKTHLPSFLDERRRLRFRMRESTPVGPKRICSGRRRPKFFGDGCDMLRMQRAADRRIRREQVRERNSKRCVRGRAA